jgi:hypothetical protein
MVIVEVIALWPLTATIERPCELSLLRCPVAEGLRAIMRARSVDFPR